MALTLPSSTSIFSSKNPHLLVKPHLHPLSNKSTQFSTKSQNSPTEPPISSQPTTGTSSSSAPPKNPNSTGLGFGSSSISNPVTTKKKTKGRGERAAVIRREPVEKPKFIEPIDENKLKEQGKNESAFLLTWLGLGSVIFVQGILLSISGFLPEEWDNFCVKYIYPSFTPTVGFFLAGTVVYGVTKYLQNEKANSQN